VDAKVYGMEPCEIILVMAKGRAFKEAYIVLVFSLDKLTQCNVVNPNFKWSFWHYKKKVRIRFYLKK